MRQHAVWWGLIASAAVFAAAFAWQAGVFRKTAPAPGPTAAAGAERDEWFGIYQNGEKIGFSHRRLSPARDGYRLTDDTRLRINAMGMIQEVSLSTAADLNPDLSLGRFDVRLSSNRFSFHAKGAVAEGAVALEVEGRRSRIPLEGPVFLTNTVMDAAAAMDLEPGGTVTVDLFDPAAMTRRPVRVKYEGPEAVTVNGESIQTRRLVLDLMGARQEVWMTAAGRVVKEAGPLGMTLLAEGPEAAAGLSDAPLQDLTRLASVPIEGDLGDPSRLRRLTLRIDGLPDSLDADGGRQERSGDRIVLRRESLETPARGGADAARFVSPSPLVQSDAPAIVEAAGRVTSGASTDAEKARRLVSWVYRHLRKQPVVSVPNALEILENRVGDCNEHAVLLAALGRAAGIPTRIEAGLVAMDGRFFYHAWNGFYLDGWVTADAVFDQLPADLTHVRLVIGGLERQIDLMGVIGRITATVEEALYD